MSTLDKSLTKALLVAVNDRIWTSNRPRRARDALRAFAFWVREDGLDSPYTLAEEQRDEWADPVIEAVADAIRESQNERRKS